MMASSVTPPAEDEGAKVDGAVEVAIESYWEYDKKQLKGLDR